MHAAVIVTAIVLVVVTAALALAPQLHLGYPQEAVDLALDTAASVIGLLACFLVFGRLRRRTRLNELLLAGALAVLGALQPVPVHRAGRSGLGTGRPDRLAGARCHVIRRPAVRPRRIPAGPSIAAVRAAACRGRGRRDHSAAGDHDLRPRVRSTVAAAGGGFPGARLVHPPRSASGAVRPAARGGGAVRSGRRRVPAVLAAAAVTSSSAGWPSPPC